MALLLSLVGTPLARAQTLDESLLRQQDAVAAAASAVARARAGGARRRDIADLMVVYRALVEDLESQTPAVDPSSQTARRQHAVAALSAATANNEVAASPRAEIDAWLGPLAARLDLLQSALLAVQRVASPELVSGMVLDVENQALAVMVAAAHDATAAEAEARAAHVRAASLQAAVAPGDRLRFATQVDIQTLLAAASEASGRAETMWTVRDRAAQLLALAQQAMPASQDP